MALIYRSILEVEGGDLLANAPHLFADWVGPKLALPQFELPVDGEVHNLGDGYEASGAKVSEDGKAAFRAHLFEKRDREEVKTTFIVLADGDATWAWIDLERWADDAWEGSWVPYAPGIVGRVLESAHCRRGSCVFENRYQVLEGDKGAALAEQILDPEREAPLVVATPTAPERQSSLDPAEERARQLQRRLAGVAPVYLLGKGAVSAFSRAMLEVGAEMDVHSGAVRTYLPGAGDDRDVPWRHRYLPYRRLARRKSDMASLLVAPPLMRAASHQPPPKLWRELRHRPEFATGAVSDAELEQLVDVAEQERADALEHLKSADSRANDAEAALDLERETQVELLTERGDLVRRLNYAEAQLRKRGEPPVPPLDEPAFAPELCEEVVDHVEANCDRLMLGPQVRVGAEQLDGHAEPAWAKKAIRAFQALQAYAEGKADGDGNGDFRTFCLEGDSLHVIPGSWVAANESETTDQNQRYRNLRTFEVELDVDASGSVYMPAHIKIDKGGTPAPRIHFHDDTDGATGKIHVGWLGPHLDNKSKT